MWLGWSSLKVTVIKPECNIIVLESFENIAGQHILSYQCTKYSQIDLIHVAKSCIQIGLVYMPMLFWVTFVIACLPRTHPLACIGS